MRDTADVSRRGVLRASAGAAAGGGATVAVTGSAAAQQAELSVGTDDAPLAYVPETLEIEPGTTVTFVWGTDNHNILLEEGPEDGWEGIEEIYDAGHEEEHTFEVEGTYEIYCGPHLDAGMVGEIVVEEGITEQDPAAGPPTVPDTAMSIAIGTTAAMASTLALAYFFLKYGGRGED